MFGKANASDTYYVSLFQLLVGAICGSLLVSADGATNGNVSFVTEHVYVEEKLYAEATFNLKREAGNSGMVYLACKILNATNVSDFVDESGGALFGDKVTSTSCTFTVVNDNTPEPNITYSVGISVLSGGAVVVEPSIAYVTIIANDDPFGVIGFSTANQRLTVAEPLPGQQSIAEFNVTRTRGTFGMVILNWQVNAGSVGPITDVSPTSGSVTFNNGERFKTIRVAVLPDNFPEAEETFTIQLTNVSGGAVINATHGSAMIVIPMNDPAVYFQTSSVTVNESQILRIEILRGISRNNLIEATGSTTTVYYSTVDGTAKAGIDFVYVNASLTFNRSETRKWINITILKDPHPEVVENFTLVLFNPSSGSVLGTPNALVVNIAKNDDPHGVISFKSLNMNDVPPLLLDEDASNAISLQVNRSQGTFGNVMVYWRAIPGARTPSLVPRNELDSSEGTVTFLQHVSIMNIPLRAKQDNVPEEAKELNIELLNATGGARLASPSTQARVIIRDSDNAYGIVQLANHSEHRVLLFSTPRKILVSVKRSGGSLGPITVNYTAAYLLSGASSPSADVQLTYPGSLLMPAGAKNATIEIDVAENSFLKSGAVVQITLTSVRIAKSTIIEPVSPVLGFIRTVSINITSNLANGEIAFFNSPITMIVEETDRNHSISLPLMRDGIANQATVLWKITHQTSSFTSADASPWNGALTFPAGSDRINLNIMIHPDNIAELDETFIVELTNVTEENERLRTGATRATVTIRRNDNPGGRFEFNFTGPSIILKENELYVLNVIRLGGALTVQRMKVEIVNGKDEFTVTQSILKFDPNERNKLFYVYPVNDNKPERNETYDIRLTAIGDTLLNNKTSVQVTILQNDDANGLFSFLNTEENLNKIAVELKNSPNGISFDITRGRGRFGFVSVYWNATSLTTSKALADIQKSSGRVDFKDGDGSKSISIIINPDKIPEEEERFAIHLVNATGGGKLVAPMQALLTINANDAPVNFSAPTNVDVIEGQRANLTIALHRVMTSNIIVTYSTVDVTASASSGDYTSVINGTVTFHANESSKTISILTMNDTLSEDSEVFKVRLVASSGDSVLVHPMEATVTILPSDYPYGIFQFSDAQMITMSEGNRITLTIQRLRGLFGNITVSWSIVSMSKKTIVENSEFITTKGNVLFNAGTASRTLTITARQDGVPELNETFYVMLTNISGNSGVASYAKLGSLTEVPILILPSDDPYGVLEFSTSSLQVSIAEDYQPGFINTTYANLTVERKKGAFAAVKALWQMYKASAEPNLPDRIWDLIFHGVRGVAISEVPGRNDSGTPGLSFNRDNDSYVFVPEKDLPAPSSLANGFTFSLWMKPNADGHGTILTKHDATSGGDILTLHLSTANSNAAIIVNISANSYNVSVPSSFRLFDGNWHNLILTVSKTKLSIYIDGAKLAERPLSSQVRHTAVVMYLGCNRPSLNHFSGSLQDVRLYPKVLLSAHIAEISSSSKVLIPTEGYLDFPINSSKAMINVKTIDNTIPQPDTVYILKLIDVKGGGRLGNTNAEARLTVLKSDNANGQFAFTSSHCPQRIYENQTQTLLNIRRTIGSFDTVTVKWEIRQMTAGRPLASSDFRSATGDVVFSQGQTEKQLTIELVNDNIPELEERFELWLVSAIPADGPTASTPNSGATIKPNFDRCNISIIASDYPYGVLQISPDKPPGSGIIPPLARPLNATVSEEAGNLTLFVNRAQGGVGTVTCEWKTNPMTARGGVDYVTGIGSLTFGPGVNSTRISIKIIDNTKPELAKTFGVQLYNPSGGAVLGTASSIQVIIESSDDAYGVFSFADMSHSFTVHEASHSSVTLRIQRQRGLLGVVNVTWKLTNGSNDFSQQDGSLLFINGQNETQLTINIVDDNIPELSEIFSIQLTGVSMGRLAAVNTTASIKILGNDDPYGIFELSSTPMHVAEGNTTLSISITRRGGSLGNVNVTYETVAIASNMPLATPGSDYIPLSNTIVFVNGQTSATINLTILDDSVPESDEYIYVNLTHVVLLDRNTEIIANSPRIGGGKRTAIVIINTNDNANGVLQLSASAITVYERISSNFLNLTRADGDFGEVSVRFEIQDHGATRGADYSVSSFNIIMNSRQRTAPVPVTILNDNLPEFTESFIIKLIESSLTGGAKLGVPRECVVSIAENDYPYGLIGFASGSLTKSVQEPQSGATRATFTVIRNGGSNGIVQVEWNATLSGRLASIDVTPSSGSIRYLSGETTKDINLSILADVVPEDNETIQINLRYVSNGKASINNLSRVATLNILANDNPYGVVQFALSTYRIEEKSNDINISLSVIRTNGLFQTIRVFYRTVPALLAINQASAGNDYENIVPETYIEMGPGVAMANISIKILEDDIPELDEQFLVEITRAELATSSSVVVPIGSNRSVNVTISANDQPYGLFGIYIANTGTNGRTYSIKEPDTSPASINFVIKREQGLLSTVSVSWRVSSKSTVNVTTDVAGVSGGQITFENNAREKSFTIAVNSDNLPEVDEYLIIELYNPTGGAVVNPLEREATLIIQANDGVGGRIGFSAGSRSRTVKEGGSVALSVYRTAPAAGNVTVNWTIEGTNASLDFMKTAGTLFIAQGKQNILLQLETRNDSIPEKSEVFLIRLSSPITTGISSTGAATLVPGDSTASIVIGANDEPHGVFEFAPQSQPLRVKENIGKIALRVVRNFGHIGDVILTYQLQGVRLNERITNAIPGEDFNSTVSNSIVIPDGNDTGTIDINIIDDNIPEQDEAFFVNLTSVYLRTKDNMTANPKLGNMRSIQIQIEANDGTQGELAFAPNSERVTVPEKARSFNITVIRKKGNFGDVYAFYLLNRLSASVSDFDIPGGVMNGPAKLTFKNGQRERNITILIKDDNITEPAEQFEIQLTIQNAVDNGGVKIGNPSKSVITIAANDDANGVISFESRSLLQAISEPSSASSINKTAVFYLKRDIGTYGTVVVRWHVLGVANAVDINPINGSVTFQPNDRQRDFQISALPDNLPELTKTYTVQIHVTSGGARTGSPNTATLIISANDDPHGRFNIKALPSLLNSINVEESTRSVQTIVQRHGGTIGKVSVQYETVQGSATSASGMKITLGFEQVFDTKSAESFHSFNANGKEYLLLASSSQHEMAGSSTSSRSLQVPFESTLFRWQGTFVPLLTLITDGAVKWKSFQVSNQTYFISVNHGAAGKFETYSQVFRLWPNETIELVQNISTKGASDVTFFNSNGQLYLLITNQKDNTGSTNMQSQLLKWQGKQFALESASFPTYGASAVVAFSINSIFYIAVANNYDSTAATYTTSSSVFQWSPSNNRFSNFQRISTQGAVDVDAVSIGTKNYLFFTNSKGSSRLYEYKSTNPPGFIELQEISISDAKTGKFFTLNNTVYLVVAANDSLLFKWDARSRTFQNITSIPVKNATSITPFTTSDSVAGDSNCLAIVTDRNSYILRITSLNDTADFVARRGELIFYEGQSALKLDFTVLKDNLPEMDELFSVRLLNPTGGAILEPNANLRINILSNDNAYGRLAFAENSLRVSVREQQWDSVLRLDVIREFGSYGQVSVNWNISSMIGSRIDDVYPHQGAINLNEGISKASINIYIRGDRTPELNEVYRVSLVSVRIVGSSGSNRGPTINYLKNSAMVTVLANNDPYGVIRWKNQLEITTKEKEINSSVLLMITRQYGSLGDIMISYETVQASRVLTNERIAIPGVDYVPKKSSVLMRQGVYEVPVYITVRHDNNTDVNEIFYVNITNVTLVSGTAVPNSPRIDPNQNHVEVVITETNASRGVVEFPSTSAIRVTESSGVLPLELNRINGSQGTVGVRYTISFITASSTDIYPHSGIVTFSNNVTKAKLNITIINDSVPELDETFKVALTKPYGGVQIGYNSQVNVTIIENDNPYGLLSFQQRLISDVVEGNVVTLTVDRHQGTYRPIVVNWTCGNLAQNDLNPWFGSLFFNTNSTQQVITITVVNDTIPELAEMFSCVLVSASNGAVISSNNTVNITVLANDKPHGVIAIDAASRSVAVGEPTLAGYDGRFTVTLLRSIGFDGLIQVNWRLRSVSGVDNSFETFNVTSGSVQFPSGTSRQTIHIQVNDDSVPEESKVYVLSLDTIYGGAELDLGNASKSYITVVASDNPYGTINFQPPLQRNITESAGRLNITLHRSGGLIGLLQVRFTTTGSTALPGVDFNPGQGDVFFNPGENVTSFQINIVNDSIPELMETIIVNLTSVNLVTSRRMNYGLMNGLKIDAPPTIGPQSKLSLWIDENDMPYGTISFVQSTFLVHEREGMVSIPVRRTGGLFDDSTVTFTYKPGTANYSEDFTVNGSSLTFSKGERQKFITVYIVNDRISEFQETFTLNLTGVTGKASLGPTTLLTVTIETSDNPYGLFGIFNTSLSVTVANPDSNRLLSFPLSRIDGALGQSQVSWRVIRTVQSLSTITEDISPPDGTITFLANERGPKAINITVLPSGGPQEPQEQFILNVHSASGGASLDQSFTNVTITVLKKGHPNGLFGFSGALSPGSNVNEPSPVRIRVKRERGTDGSVNVIWSVTSVTGSIDRDLAIRNRTLIFLNGESQKDIVIDVLADNIPELDETFTISLTSVNNGAEIDASKQNISFTIKANGYPHGLFRMLETGKRFEFNAGTLDRVLHFVVQRQNGTIGSVQVSIQIEYSDDRTTDTHRITVANGQNITASFFNISSTRFLKFGANFSVRIQQVNLLNSGSSMAPAIDATSPSILINIPEQAANSILEFNANSRNLVASSTYEVSNVLVSRIGLFGQITVNWRSGYPAGGFTIGSISPALGSLSFAQGERTKSFSFRATIPPSVQNNLVFAVYLSAATPSRGQPAWPRIGSSNTAIVDAHGVVEISLTAVTVTEGSRASVQIRRLLSTIGNIRVNYTTESYSGANAATAKVDYTPESTYIDMSQGQTIATIQITTLEDNVANAERDELFYVRLTSVQVMPSSASISSSSPRLSVKNRTTITIRDNDDPFGIISFTTASNEVTAQESSGQVTLQIQRTGGVFSRVTVLVRSLGGGEVWQSEILNALPASSSVKSTVSGRRHAASAVTPKQDYVPLNTEIIFEELNSIPSGGQIKTVNLTILSDSSSEPDEELVVLLSNVTGGARLPLPSESTKAFSVVRIAGNGLWNGEVGFTVGTSSINEDTTAQTTIPLQRNGGTAETIEIDWRVWSPSFNVANQIVETSGKARFMAGNSTSSITINAKNDTIPEFASWFFVNISTTANGAIIVGSSSSLFAFCNISMPESDYPAGRIGFDSRYRYPIVYLGDQTKELRVRRYDGALKDVTVRYQTVSLSTVVTNAGIRMNPAVENEDYKSAAGIINFLKGRTEATIKLQFSAATASVGGYPKVFNVTLLSPENGALLKTDFQNEQVIIVKDSQTGTFLSLRSDALKRPLTDTEIENIFSRMLVLVKIPPLSDDSQKIIMKTIRLITSYKSTLPVGSRALSTNSKSLLLDIFDSLLTTTRTDTRGKSSWAILLDELAYDFLNDAACPSSFTGNKLNFALNSRRDSGKNLNGVKFTSRKNADFFRYPINMFDPSGSTSCTDLHFIDYSNQQFFSSGKSVLNNKVMSSAIKSGLSSGMKVVYRIHTSKQRVTKPGVSCVIWKHASAGSKGFWNSNKCKIKGETQTYVECECQHLSQYAVLALSDNRTGYETYFFVACFLCMSACFLALLAHYIFIAERTLTVKLFLHMLFALMMTNILYVVGAYISPSLINKPTNCGILAVSIHYFFLAQFAWMFAQACNLWRILVMNDENTHRKYVHFFLVGWGLPVLIIAGYVFVTIAAYSWPFASMYGDVHKNGDMCFIPNSYAAYGTVIIPVLLFIFGVVVVAVQSYQVKPQWQCYDDVYRGFHNVIEIRYFLILYLLMTIAYLFAGLHLAYGSLWMIATFTAFNILLGLYIFVLYAIMPCVRRHLGYQKYTIGAGHSELSNHELIYAPGSSNYSARKLVDSQSNRLSEWEDLELPINLDPIDATDKARILDSTRFGSGMGRVNESYDNDFESDEFDDLIFALKAGGQTTPSLQDEQELEQRPSSRSISADQPNVKRIKIADTHL